MQMQLEREKRIKEWQAREQEFRVARDKEFRKRKKRRRQVCL